MSETYCGKSCAECTYKEDLSCIGCHEGLGRPIDGECRIARCCRGKSRTSCEGCTPDKACLLIANRDSVPADLLSQRQAFDFRIRQIIPRYSRLLTLYSVLLIFFEAASFIILIPSAAGWLKLSEFFIYCVILVARLLSCTALLLLMSPASKKYRMAGIMLLCNAAQFLALLCFGLTSSLITQIFTWLWMHFEMSGHMEATDGINKFSHSTWTFLHKWLLISSVAGYITRDILPSYSFLLLMIMIIVSIAELALIIARLIVTFQTAQFFRDVAADVRAEGKG